MGHRFRHYLSRAVPDVTRRRGSTGRSPAEDGARTAIEGTPFAVDVSRDRRAHVKWIVFLAGPVIWFAHFMVVYLVAEAGCTGGGPGLRVFNHPVPTIVTVAATGVASIACLGFAGWAYVRWRGSKKDSPATRSGDPEDEDRGAEPAFAGFLLSLLFFIAILMDGLPAVVLRAC